MPMKSTALKTSKHKGHTMKIGDYIFTTIYGRTERCKVLAIHSGGTVDVECLNGRCFRISGLAIMKEVTL